MSRDIVVLDLEVLNSPDWCRHCRQEKHQHVQDQCVGNPMKYFEQIGWNDHYLLGISIGCAWESRTDRYSFFDESTVEALMRDLVERQVCLVTYNGKTFDGSVMANCLGRELGGCAAQEKYTDLVTSWFALVVASYDVLAEIWEQDSTSRFQKGNGLDAVSQSNGYGAKEMDGASAPAAWRQGQYAAVANYCMSDVWKTRKLFEQAQRGELIRRRGLKAVKLRTVEEMYG